ncbi:MAG TPA: hypothetical protein VGE38_11475 [Nocardioides sp.]|uniref:hypothetical protein n=1 Tax=Nocardioides sp. TaxID=35761 RepID=UPI002EDAF7FF
MAASDSSPPVQQPVQRPVLRPGWQAVRRDDAHLQVGLDEPLCTVVPDTAEVRRLLAVLADPALPWQPPADLPSRRALDRLDSAGLLVPRPASALETRLAARHGQDARERLSRRARSLLRLDGPSALTEPFEALLRESGLAAVSGQASDEPTLTMLLSAGPAPRPRADELLRHGRPHLVVAGSPTGWTVGPLVVPGLTACLRCVDATLAERDPRRGVVLAQQPPVSPALLDPVARIAALALAAQQTVAFVDGDAPAVWSATLSLRAGVPELVSWRRHPHCGCAWDAVAAQ